MATNRLRRSLGLVIVLSLLLIRPLGSSAPRVQAQTDPTTRFTYDANGNIASRTAPDGAVTTYRYDPNDRLVEIRYADGTAVAFAYDALGRRVRMTDAIGETRTSYDIHGRITQVTDPHGQAIAYEYDPRGLVTALTYPDGTRAAYTWDRNGQLVAAEDRAGATRYQYDAAGKLTQRTLPNGVVSTYGYDQANRLASIRHAAPSGAPLLEIAYAYDAGGSRSEMTRIVAGGAPEVTRYAYDDLVRLTRVTYPDGETVTYSYGPTGNRLAMTSSKTGETRYAYDGLGRLASIQGPGGDETLAYDANGNLVRRTHNGQETAYVWDGENRLIGVRGGSSQVVFRYDGDGRRLEKIADGKVTQYVQDGNVIPQVLLATNADGAIRSLPGQPGSGEAGPTSTLYYLEDGLGSVVGATDTNGALVGTAEYDAFGAPRGSDTLPTEFGYAGEQADPETGLVFLRARYYDPTSGRFISRDTFPPLTTEPSTFNTYAYVRNNPIDLIDPLGLDSQAPCALNYSYCNTYVHAVLKYQYGIDLTGLRANQMFDLFRMASRGELQLANHQGQRVFVSEIRYDPANKSHVASVQQALNSGAIVIPAWKNPNAAGSGHVAEVSTVGQLPGREWRGAEIAVNQAVLGGKAGLDVPLAKAFASAKLESKTGEFTFYVLNRENSAPPAGGVLLDQAASILGDLTDIAGASYDPALGQLILIGSQDASLPPMDKDDLAVAIRAVLSGEDPGMTMVPVDPTMADITQRVQYFGQTENTRFGLVMFEADRYLKSLAAGTDTLTGQPVAVAVPGFKSELALSVELCTDVPWHRNWFVPDQVVLKQSPDGRSMMFDEATIKLESRFIAFDNGEVQDVAGDSPVTQEFTRFVTEHYAELAAGKAELAELIRLAKIVGVVKWLVDAGIPIDLSWMKDYRIAQVETPTTTPGIKATASDPSCPYVITSAGGVGMTTPNTVVPETSGETTAVASQALVARPADLPITWPVQHNGQALTAVAMNLAPTPIVGGYADSWTDAAVPLAGGQSAAIVRAYNSVDTHASVLGPGWSLVLPALAFSRTPVLDRPGYFNTAAELAIGPTRIAFRGVSSDGLYLPRDLTGEYDALGIVQAGDTRVRGFPDGFTPVPAIPGQPIAVRNERDELLQVDRFALMAKDGRVLLFDPLGRLVGLRDAAGNQVDYRYDGERLAEIRDASQRGIRLDYDAGGRLAQLTGSDGSTVRYAYDANGNLVTVSDEAGTRSEYVYDGANRLATVLDEAGRQVRENAYDSLGRVINTRAGALAETVQVSYDGQASSARYVTSTGAPAILQYDSQKRLTERTDRLGNKQAFRYDADGRLVAATDPKGQTTTYLYDSNGFLTEAVSPLGERTRWLGYSQQGVPQASIDAANQLTFFEYDERGRVKAIASGYQLGELSADGSISYSEVAPQVVALTYDPVGNLSSVQDPAGATTRYSYDAVGNLTQTTLPEGGTITQTYDGRSRLESIQDPSGFRIDFDYDPRGQVTQIASPAGVIRYAYAGGRLAAVTDPAGRVTQFGFDGQGRLATVVEATDTTTTYEYDPASNLSAVVDAQGGRTEFQYDAMNRLVARVQRGSGGAGAGAPPEPTAAAPAESGHPAHGHVEPEEPSPTPTAAALAALATPAPGTTTTTDMAMETPAAPDSTADTSPFRWMVLAVAGGAIVLGVAIVLSLLLVRSSRQKRKKARARQRALDESYTFPDRSDDSGW